MSGEPSLVERYVPSTEVPKDLVKQTAPRTFQINPGLEPSMLGKVKGAPTAEEPAHAGREAFLACQLALREDVTDVFLGDAAVEYMYGKKTKVSGQQDVDVIAILKNKQHVIADAKGVHFGKALVQQLPHTAWVLNSKGLVVAEGMVVALQPRTIIVSAALGGGTGEWNQVGSQLESIDPARVANFNSNHPADPNLIYLLDPDFHAVHNPTGLVIEPYRKFPQLKSHIRAHTLGPRRHMDPGIWSDIDNFTIPTTSATVKIGFVR